MKAGIGWLLFSVAAAGCVVGDPEGGLASDVAYKKPPRIDAAPPIDARPIDAPPPPIDAAPIDAAPIDAAPGGSGTISGTIFFETGAPANVGVSVWVDEPNGHGRYWGGATIDGQGGYIKTGLPPQGVAMLQLTGVPGGSSGYQACVNKGAYDGANSTVNGLIFTPALILGPDPAPPPGNSPVISGRVYEVVGGQQVPISGAYIDIDLLDGLGLYGGSTQTNAEGEYFVCRIPPSRTVLYFMAEGFNTREIPVAGVNSTLDVQMTRL